MSDPVDAVETFVRMLSELATPHATSPTAIELVPDRLLIAVNSADEPELYVLGERATFGASLLSRVLSWDLFAIDGVDEPVPSLVVRTVPGSGGRRVMAHIAYEAFRLVNDGITNHELLERLNPFLLLAQSKQLLAALEQTGLVGELLVLELLLGACADASSQERALASWVGPLGAQHDFFRNGMVIEVKTGPGSAHRVGYRQLLPGPNERLYLASPRVRRDASAQLKLPDLVQRVLEGLQTDGLRTALNGRLEKYGSGYYSDLAEHYRMEHGFDVGDIELRQITLDRPILTPASFSPGHPPPTVSDIRYQLDVTGIPTLSAGESQAVLEAMVAGQV